MAINTLPAKYILRKHNLEMYLTKKIEPLVPFLNLLPTADNDTGEFATVIESTTAKEDMDNEKLSEPLMVTEGSDLTDVTIEPLNAQLGKTAVVGYQFKYTKQFLRRQDSDARINLATSKIIAGMAHKLNALIGKGISDSATASFPSNLSDWDTAIDPRADMIKLRDAFESGASGTDDLPFSLDTCLVSNTKHVKLQDYYMSFDKEFNNKSIDVDGTEVRNIKNSFSGLSGVDLIGLDSQIPCGIIEKYVDPAYSTIRQAELSDAQANMNIPQSLINVNLIEPVKFEDPYIYQVVAELGFSCQEPKGAVKGAL